MRVVITGGAGFIGSNLAERLAADGIEVVAVDDLSNGFEENLRGVDAELVVGSILDAEVLDRTFAGADCIVHFAARGSVPKSLADPVATHERNNTGTLMVLEAARRAGDLHTVVASSSSVYGAVPDLPKHEDLATRPMSPYAVEQAGHRVVRPRLSALVRAADDGVPVLQRVRTSPAGGTCLRRR